MNHSEQINEIAKALASCQGEMSFASKDSLNPHFKSRYADLSAVWDAIREPLSKHGLSVSQILEIVDGKPVLISILMHSSGQWLKSTIPVINANNTSQGQGSGITYARRYALAALVGCVQDDDDGQESMPKNGNNQKKESKPKTEEKTISSHQILEIESLMRLAENSYNDKVLKRLAHLGHERLIDIPCSMYDMIVEGLKKNIEIVDKKKRESENV